MLLDAVPGWILSLKDRRQAPICLGGLEGAGKRDPPVGNYKPLLSASTRQMIGLGQEGQEDLEGEDEGELLTLPSQECHG